jgi:maleylacetoacetate isomerase
MSDFVLYSYFRSSASYRVRIALHLKDLDFEYRPVHLLNNGGEQHTAEYRALNPSREVPTLLHDGKVLAQSVAILEYLDEIGTKPRLYPQDPYQRSLVRQFCETINCVQPMQNLRTTQFMKNDMRLSEEMTQMWLNHWLGRAMESIEAQLQKHAGRFCIGNEISAADCFLVPQVFSAHRLGINLEPYARVRQMNEQLEKMEAFQKAHPIRQPDTPK